MACYKAQDHNNLLLAEVLSGQTRSASFAFRLNYLVDQEPEFGVRNARFNQDEAGANPPNLISLVI